MTKPIIVTLCGSTRFKDAFATALLNETLQGKIVLTVGCFTHSDVELELTDEVKMDLDTLHMRKIDISDEIYVLNVNGYVGESTSREIAYAHSQKKEIRWLEESPSNPWRIEYAYDKWVNDPHYIQITEPDRPKTCPYPGCENPYVNRPPCAICYE